LTVLSIVSFAIGVFALLVLRADPIWLQITVGAAGAIGLAIVSFAIGLVALLALRAHLMGLRNTFEDAGAISLAIVSFAIALLSLLAFRAHPMWLRITFGAAGAIGLAVAWRQSYRLLPWFTVALVTLYAVRLVHQLSFAQPPYLHGWTLALTVAVPILPWLLPRRMLAAFVVFVFANAVWLSAFSLSGSFSWWNVGFLYGTKKHDVMQLGAQSLSNLSSLLSRRYQWDLHELAGRFSFSAFEPSKAGITIVALCVAAALCCGAILLYLRRGRRDWRWLAAAVVPWILFAMFWAQLSPHPSIGSSMATPVPTEMELKDTMATLFFICVAICAGGAAVHLRRRDPRFLVAMVAPWMLFLALLPQLAARYSILVATVSACLIGVSIPMGLFNLLLTTIACMMLGNQMLANNPQMAPITFTITRPTHPDFGWATLALALFFLFAALSPSTKRNRLSS
jgi:hypothetical protein